MQHNLSTFPRASRNTMRMLDLGLVALVATLATPDAFAQVTQVSGGQTLGRIFDNVTVSLKGADGMVQAILWVAAFIFGCAAAFKFKSYADNPRETPLKTPFMLLLTAILCMSLPFLLSSGSKTLFEQDTINAPTFQRTNP